MRRGGAPRAAAAATLVGALALASCGPTPAPRPPAGTAGARQPAADAAYRIGNLWFYPREDASLAETGLASVAPDARAGRITASGEAHDPAVASAAHRTVLPLPAALRVTNLETGRELVLRANDRGPRDPGRVVELSRRAADLLGVAPGRPAQVRVAVEPEGTRALAAASGRSPSIAVAAAPVGRVERESLAPPPGAAAASRLRQVAPAPVALAASRDAPAAPVAFGERVSALSPAPGRLFVQLGAFETADPARRQAARLPGGARAEPAGASPRAGWRVRLGPYATPAEADAALERVLATGVSEARILVD